MVFCGDMSFYLTHLDKVCDEKGKVISLNDFLKKINKAIDIRGASDFEVNITENSIVFECKRSTFLSSVCVYPDGYDDDFRCELILDKIVMENFKIGNYNEATSKIKVLIDKMNGKIITNDTLCGAFIKDEETLEIIKKCKDGKNDDGKFLEVYLKYLQKSRNNYMGIGNFLRYLKTTIFINRNAVRELIYKLTHFEWFEELKYKMIYDEKNSKFASLALSIFISGVSFGFGFLALKNLGLLVGILKLLIGAAIFIPASYYLLLPIMFHGCFVVQRIISRLENKLEINRKIQQLQRELNEFKHDYIDMGREESVSLGSKLTKEGAGLENSKPSVLNSSFTVTNEKEFISDKVVGSQGQKKRLILKPKGQNSSRQKL